MLKSLILAVLAFSCLAPAMDEYAPIAPKTLQLEPMFAYSSVTGGYDASGTHQSLPSGTSVTGQAYGALLKLGAAEGVDLEVQVLYEHVSQEISGTSQSANGFMRPDVALKYLSRSGFGAFAGMDLPIGSKEIVGSSPFFSFYFGAITVQKVDRLSFNGLLTFAMTLKNQGYTPGNILSITLKPQFDLTETVGPYVGLTFRKTFEATLDGYGHDDGSDLLTLQPGANFTLSNSLTVETAVPFTVTGKNANSYWGIALVARYSFGL